ncbi:MAG: hypothetical protein WBM13_12090 [Bacteroidia bacterium]
MKKKVYLNYIFIISFIFLNVFFNHLKAQDNVGIGTNTPDVSAKLELYSPNKGLLVPRMSTVGMNAIASPANSLLIYNTDSMCYYFYRQPTNSWISMCNAGYSNSVDSFFISTAFIDSLFSNYVSIDSLFASYVNIDSLFANYISVDSLVANYALIDSLFVNHISADSLFANYANFDSLFASYVNIDSLFANYGYFDSLFAHYISADSIYAHYGNFDSLFVNGVSIQSLIDSLGAASSYCSNATTNFVTKFTSPTSVCNSIIYDNGTQIGINTTTPSVSLHINATDAIAMPAGTTAQQPFSPPVGSNRYNTTTGVMEVYNGTCWQNINTPPIGSSYIQWFNVADPNTIYPCTVWIATDISNGEFIRATGGLSNVSAPPLTGVVQSFASQDHAHSVSSSIGNAGALATSADGSHNHGGATTGVGTFNTSTWIPYDDNLGNSTGNPGDFSGVDPTTCGSGWNGKPTGGNFLGQQNQGCLDHTHYIYADGYHAHTVQDHTHALSVGVGSMSSGNISTETRPTNVAVSFWRRIQ